MNSYKLEDIEKLAAATGMRTYIYDDGIVGMVHVFLGDYHVSAFKKIFKDMPIYEILWTFTKVSEYSGNIRLANSVSGKQFFGDLHAVYENMSKKYKELLKTIKAAEIKNCRAEYVVG